MRFIVETLLPVVLFVGFICLLGYGISCLEQENEDIREAQRASCIVAGGKYAEAEGPNARPHSDYCIK